MSIFNMCWLYIIIDTGIWW